MNADKTEKWQNDGGQNDRWSSGFSLRNGGVGSQGFICRALKRHATGAIAFSSRRERRLKPELQQPTWRRRQKTDFPVLNLPVVSWSSSARIRVIPGSLCFFENLAR
jgi:hypothetical protein